MNDNIPTDDEYDYDVLDYYDDEADDCRCTECDGTGRSFGTTCEYCEGTGIEP